MLMLMLILTLRQVVVAFLGHTSAPRIAKGPVELEKENKMSIRSNNRSNRWIMLRNR